MGRLYEPAFLADLIQLNGERAVSESPLSPHGGESFLYLG